MTKLALQTFQNRKKALAHCDLKQSLKEQNACYVLITCKEPAADGSMQVEMSYEGDESLASYLLDSAKLAFHQEVKEPVDSY